MILTQSTERVRRGLQSVSSLALRSARRQGGKEACTRLSLGIEHVDTDG